MAKSSNILLDAPNLGKLEKKYLCKAIDEGYVSTFGPLIGEFERKFSRFVDVNYAVSLQSGTAALHLALLELGIGPADEVIVPAMTFIASVNPILYVRAKPVFVDVDLKSWNIDPQKIEQAITKKTKAIIAVHLYGNPCAMDEIMALAKKYKLYVIEDATESLGALYKGRHTGSWADMGCFSFNGNKIITTGGGGMIIGKNKQQLEHMRFLANQARVEGDYFHTELGFNYRMTNIEAALGLAQLKQLNRFLAQKKRFNRIYRQQLAGTGVISFQQEYAQASSSWWFTSVLFDKRINIADLQIKLKKYGIPTRRVFPLIVQNKIYRKYKKNKLTNAEYIYQHGLNLPCSTLNSCDDIYFITQKIKKSIENG